ncbi:hypothetical protein MMPV_007526 [Pyropia vietnamensis]
MAAAMPEYAFLRRCARARAWLADVWDPTAVPPPCPPLNATALAGAVACDKVLRFPTATAPMACGAPPEDLDSYLPPDEADGSGLGPILVDYTVMGVPVEAPPLRRTWAAMAGGGAVPAADQLSETPAAPDVQIQADDGAYDEDDEVVTVHFVFDVQRDLTRVATNGMVSIQPTARGVMHRRTGETILLMTSAAPPGLPVARLLMMEYCVPDANGGVTEVLSSLGVSDSGSLVLLNRMDALMQPSDPRPTPIFCPADGVTAMATYARSMHGAFGVAYAPRAPPGTTLAALTAGPGGEAGGLPQLLSLVCCSTPASAATTARMRSRAVAALLPPPRPPRLLSAGDTASVNVAAAVAAKYRTGGRRLRRARLDLTLVGSEAERQRIVRNRASAARSNAARRQARLEARTRGVAETMSGLAGGKPALAPTAAEGVQAQGLAVRGGVLAQTPAAGPLPVLLPRL